MLKNPYYQYGSKDLQLPAHLNFSEFVLTKLVQNSGQTLINGVTNEAITYGEIAQKAMNLAVSLTQLGVGKGDVVAICSENRTEFWSAVVGSICTGAAFSTVNMMYTKHEITHVADISKPKYIICSPLAYARHKKSFKSLKYVKNIIVFGDERHRNTISFNDLVTAHDVRFEDFEVDDADPTKDTLFILYSSGTTGLPKGVMLTHLNVLIACTNGSIQGVNISYLVVTPWFHTMGLMGTLVYISNGWKIVYLPKFEMELYLKCIEKYRVTRLQVVPPMLVALVKHPGQYDTSSVEIILSGAAPVRKDTLEAVAKKFPNATPVMQGYGMTESTLALARDHGDPPGPKLGSVGKVLSGAIVKIIDLETRKPLGPNKSGEICVKGPLIMKGYIGRDRREDFDDEGFFKTGDVGYFDADGYMFVVDRLKELIKYKGYQVAPAEIEAVLLQHPAVRDAGVVGVPDAGAGEVPRAFVALQPGARASEHELAQFVAERLSNPKHLRGGVRFVPEIPKNPSGKILRRRLKEMLHDKSKL